MQVSLLSECIGWVSDRYLSVTDLSFSVNSVAQSMAYFSLDPLGNRSHIASNPSPRWGERPSA
jgi:hypothetical protein